MGRSQRSKPQWQVIYYANPNGTDKALFDVLINTNTPVVTQPLNFQSAVSGLTSTTVSFPAEDWSPSLPWLGIQGSFRIAPGELPAAGSNAVILGVRYTRGKRGFSSAISTRAASGSITLPTLHSRLKSRSIST